MRDNGASIGAAGGCRALLGRRHCTSKLRDSEDLRAVGGRSLGFRGEALAALAECAGVVRVTVRCGGEAVGRVLRLGSGGEGVVGGEVTGCAVGTTVRAEGLFARWPVRRQAAMRHAEAGMKRVRRMLQAFALARPGVRLELRVGRVGEKGGWLYAPKTGVGVAAGEERVADAAWKVVGREVAAQCGYAVREVNGYTVEGFLPRADAEGKKVSGLGPFVSVDARPVSTARGTLKLIAKVFREKLKKAKPALADVKEPFLRMNIKCPPGSYDPNVEPAKEDLLFDDSGAVLSAVEEFLDAVYSPALPVDQSSAVGQASAVDQAFTADQASDETVETGDMEIQMDEDENDIFEQLMNLPDSDMIPMQISEGHRSEKSALAPQNPSASAESSTVHSQTQKEQHLDDSPLPKRRRTWKYNMFDVDEDDLVVSDTEQQSTSNENHAEEETELVQNYITVSNPWTMARINARVKNTGSTNDSPSSAPLKERTESQLNAPTSSPQRPPNLLTGSYLPTPQASSPFRGRNSFSNHTTDLNLPHGLATPSASQFSTQRYDAHLTSPRGSLQHSNDGVFPVPPQPTQSTPLSTGNGGLKRQRGTAGPRKQQAGRGGANKPFKSPINPERDSWFSNVPPQRSKRSSMFLKRNELPATTNTDEPTTGAVEVRMSDGRDRDIRHWMAGNNTRATRSSTRSTAMERDSSVVHGTEVSAEPVPIIPRRQQVTSRGAHIHNFDFNRPEAGTGPRPTPAETASAGRLTLQNQTSAFQPHQQQDNGGQHESTAEVPIETPLRRSNRVLDRTVAGQQCSTEEPTHNVVGGVEAQLQQRQCPPHQPHQQTMQVQWQQKQQQAKCPEQQQQQQRRPSTSLIPTRRPSTRQNTRRRTTSNLPLERVPDGAQMHNISLTLHTGRRGTSVPDLVRRIARSLELLDPVANGLFSLGASKEDAVERGLALFGGEVLESEVVQLWADRLAVLLREVVGGGAAAAEEVREDLSFVVMEAVERQRGEVVW